MAQSISGKKRDAVDLPAHRSVMPDEVIKFLNPTGGEVIVDCTVGGGGHAELILQRISPDGLLIGIDRDNEMVAEAHRHLALYGHRVRLFCDRFDNVGRVLSEVGVERVDGLLFDLGVASQQIQQARRGFSFLLNGPLDMRYDRTVQFTAADAVNTYSQEQLEKIIKSYGEERRARLIAAAIVERRRRGRIETTGELVDVILIAVRGYERRIHPATRTFQALRIAVNDELSVVKRGLEAGVTVLNPGGRMVVLSYHSLEDRIVKRFLREKEKASLMRALTRKAVMPSREERASNPRCRSAKLRAGERL